MAFHEESSVEGHDDPWIRWFCGLKGNEMFCEVERSYIEDGFNLYGLRVCVSNFSDCLDLILDRIGPDDSDDSHLTQNACTLYGLMHARYILTAHGLDAMYSKYASKDFGTCPLVQCSGQPVLPVGLTDEVGADTVKIFCPKCQCVYHPPVVRHRSSHHSSSGSAGVDGSSFGTTFPHLFLMTFSNLVPDPLPVDSAYVPRVFGFRVHKSALQRNIPPCASPTQVSGARPADEQKERNQQPPSAGYVQDVSKSETAAVESDSKPQPTDAFASLPQQKLAGGETTGKGDDKKRSGDDSIKSSSTKRKAEGEENGVGDGSAKRKRM